VEGLLLISNATAGTNEEQALIGAVDVLMETYDVEHVETSDADDLGRALGEAADRPIVVAGGDGSLHAVVNALDDLGLLQDARLGLIPLGTGNDFARGVGIPLEPEAAAEVIKAGDLVPVDLIVDNGGRVIVNNVHLGVGADASRKAEKWKPRFGRVKLGRVGYVVGAVAAGLRPEFIKARVTVDDADLSPLGHIAQVAIGNGSTVGGGTELVPGADPSSGNLVVIVSRTAGTFSRVLYILRLRGGTHHLMKEVSRVTGTRVRVAGDEFHISADGEIDGPFTDMSWELRAGAVRMFLPLPAGESARESAQ
jgi:diacylglycerol kinase (ATP)